MSDYTPTTKIVREVWQYDQQEVDMEGWITVSFDEAGQSFDRWLAAYTAGVAERIAQAIEAEADGTDGSYADGMQHAARIAREAGKK